MNIPMPAQYQDVAKDLVALLDAMERKDFEAIDVLIEHGEPADMFIMLAAWFKASTCIVSAMTQIPEKAIIESLREGEVHVD